MKTVRTKATKRGRGKGRGDHRDDGQEDKDSVQEDGKTEVLKITGLT